MMESPTAPRIRIIENEMAFINCIIVISSIGAEILGHLRGWLSNFSIVESKTRKTALFIYSSSNIEPRATF
jgi:hypothetical protein